MPRDGASINGGQFTRRISGADLDPRVAEAAFRAFLTSRESSAIGPVADAVAAAINAVMNDPEAMRRLRRAVISGPPHGTTFDDDQRADHGRGGLVAAFAQGQKDSST
jgi:hypothetical protein